MNFPKYFQTEVKIVLILGILAFLIGGGIFVYFIFDKSAIRDSVNPTADYEQRVGKDLLACQVDSDCVIVQDGCGDKQRVISAYHDEGWNQILHKKCPVLIDRYPEFIGFPKCINARCVAKVLTFSDYSSSQCAEILNTPERDYCYVEIVSQYKDARICDKVSETSLRLCTQRLVTAINPDISYCEQLIGENQKDVCYLVIAERDGEYAHCTSISASYIKTECWQSFVNIDSVNESICQGVAAEGPEWLRDRCYATLSEKTGDATYCKIIEDNAVQTRCYQAIIPILTDVEVCIGLEKDGKDGSLEGNNCIQQVAKNKKDASICNRISPTTPDDFYPWYYCILGVAVDTQNDELCSLVSERKNPYPNYGGAYTVDWCIQKVKEGSF